VFPLKFCYLQSLNSTILPLFEKVLSASDAGRIGRLVLPKACAEVSLKVHFHTCLVLPVFFFFLGEGGGF
jgi:hypothetical protein